MNLNQLRYFVAVAEKRSFSLAAEECFLTQTAITQQVRQLEEQLGARLVDRSVRPIVLTPAGEVFCQEARNLLARMDLAVRRTREASAGGSGTLRVGYTKGYERSALSDRLRDFHHRCPGVFISCRRASSDVLSAELLSGGLDIIFTWDSTGLAADPAVEGHPVERVPLIAAFYASHPLAGRKSVARADLRGEPLFFMSPSAAGDSAADAHYLELYRKAGYTPNILLRTSDAESVLMMVAAEEGCAILPAYYTQKLDRADNLLFVPMAGEEEVELIHAFSLRKNPNPALRAFEEQLFPEGPAKNEESVNF